MPIRPSSPVELRQLIEALGEVDDIARESAVARLALMGPRAADRLLQEFPAAAPATRIGMFRALEALSDVRAVPLARTALTDPLIDLALSAIGVLRACLDATQPAIARDALDGVVGTALDVTRPSVLRLAALDALRVLPPDVREAVRRNLTSDADPEVRAKAAAGTPGPAAIPVVLDDAGWLEAVSGHLPPTPEPLKDAVTARRATARLTELQRLVDHLRTREQRETDPARREAWRAVRGAAHQALAARNSRLALYDLRDSLLEPERLPVAFLAALEEIGDETCLETLAAAYEASSRSGDAWWREHVAAAFRAIVARDGLTRRHAAVKRTMARWPEATADLMGRL